MYCLCVRSDCLFIFLQILRFNSNMTGVTNGAGTANTSRVHGFTSIVFCVLLCRLLFVFFPFSFRIFLSVLCRFTDDFWLLLLFFQAFLGTVRRINKKASWNIFICYRKTKQNNKCYRICIFFNIIAYSNINHVLKYMF